MSTSPSTPAGAGSDPTRPLPGADSLARLETRPYEGARPRFGRYEVVRKLGEGSMGVVYEARDPGLGRTVAVKVMHPAKVADPALVERFLREARAAAVLDDPHVVKVHDMGFAGQVPFVAMEYVAGEPLQALLGRARRLPVAIALRYAIHAARGLRAAWAHGIVHRDIKPANLMVTAGDVLKVADFGLARSTGQAGAALTQAGEVLGTPLYMSPEQAAGKTPDFRSDIYSLGATLYHLLAGAPPFDGESVLEILAHQIHEPLTPLRDRAPDVPRAAARVVASMLAKDPAARPASYDELLRGLEHARAAAERAPAARLLLAATAGLLLGVLAWGTGLLGGGPRGGDGAAGPGGPVAPVGPVPPGPVAPGPTPGPGPGPDPGAKPRPEPSPKGEPGPTPRPQPRQVATLFHGAVTDLGDDGVDLAYDFSSREQRRDWETTAPTSLHDVDPAAAQDWILKEGKLVAQGRAALRLCAEFAGDLEIEATVTVPADPDPGVRILFLSTPADGGYTLALAPKHLGLVWVQDRLNSKPVLHALAEDYVTPFAAGVPHPVRIKRWGDRIQVCIDGKPVLDSESSGCDRGFVGVHTRTTGTAFDAIRIRGRLTRDWLESRR